VPDTTDYIFPSGADAVHLGSRLRLFIAMQFDFVEVEQYARAYDMYGGGAAKHVVDARARLQLADSIIAENEA